MQWLASLCVRRPVFTWVLMLAFPFPYLANTLGWITAELGRQPWLIYGLMRTIDGVSPRVSAGNGLFTLLGFMGMYMLLGILFLFLVVREITQGPAAQGPADGVRQTESVRTENNQVLLEGRIR